MAALVVVLVLVPVVVVVALALALILVRRTAVVRTDTGQQVIPLAKPLYINR